MSNNSFRLLIYTTVYKKSEGKFSLWRLLQITLNKIDVNPDQSQAHLPNAALDSVCSILSYRKSNTNVPKTLVMLKVFIHVFLYGFQFSVKPLNTSNYMNTFLFFCEVKIYKFYGIK